MEFSEQTRDALKKAGWFPGRHVDISHVEAEYQDVGFEIFPPAANFLHEFSGLYVTWSMPPIKHKKYLNFRDYWVAFEPDELEDFVRILGKPLCPIGSDAGSEWYMAPDGFVYCTELSFLVQVGETGHIAIDNYILNNRCAQKVIVETPGTRAWQAGCGPETRSS